MPRFVIDPRTALRLVAEGVRPAAGVALLAPTLLRDQVLERLYRGARDGTMEPTEARRHHDRFATLKVRYLGDRVLRQTAWRVAADAGAATTFAASYVALTMLQGDALVALDDEVRALAAGRVALRPFAALGGDDA